MLKSFKYMLAILTIALVGIAAGDASYAQLQGSLGSNDTALFDQGDALVKSGLQGTEQIVYGIGGLGAIALGVLAFFGRFQWTWFFGLIGGLVVIAGINLGIGFITGQQVG